LHEYLEDFKGQEDALRYTLCATAPESKDTDFTWADFQARNNNELVAIFGNFINRVVVLTNKYWDGRVPAQNDLNEYDKKVLAKLSDFPNPVSTLDSSDFCFSYRLFNIIQISSKCPSCSNQTFC
ncbi:TPA: methionine--tRNA ligase, partial [Candidatus Pacearchaeota archaeon]|nr:methionine--tRNA ligase [Candidatus Pacearchaeota archaeon]